MQLAHTTISVIQENIRLTRQHHEKLSKKQHLQNLVTATALRHFTKRG